MKIYNTLPGFVEALKAWPKPPTREEFEQRFLAPIESLLRPMLEDFSGFRGTTIYDAIADLDWATYQAQVIQLDPVFEEARLLRQLDYVQKLLGVELKGEAVLFGAFGLMDGYARFDQGTHRVFLGVDQEHGPGAYLDILTSHELTHVARESQASVWEGLGLNPKMTHDELVSNMPVIEHLMSEGYSCVVSELINPANPPWTFVYQDKESYARVMQYASSVDTAVHSELRDPRGHYRNLYGVDNVVPVPRYAHYVWAWKWVKQLLKKRAKGDAKVLLGMSAHDLVEDALAFELS